jgi:hypothetical protein
LGFGTLFLQVAETMAEGEEGGEGRNVRELRVVESGFIRATSGQLGFGSLQPNSMILFNYHIGLD